VESKRENVLVLLGIALWGTTAHHPGISHILARFTQLVFCHGVSLNRYQAGLQVILEKKAGSIHVNKLRAILLMEADFNSAMKILIG
jgi:hypothetical protein